MATKLTVSAMNNPLRLATCRALMGDGDLLCCSGSTSGVRRSLCGSAAGLDVVRASLTSLLLERRRDSEADRESHSRDVAESAEARFRSRRVRRHKSSRERGGSEVAAIAETQKYSRERGGSKVYQRIYVSESAEARRSQRSRRLKSSRERGGSEVAESAEPQK